MGSIRDIIETSKDYLRSYASSIIDHSDFKEQISEASYNGEDTTEIEIDDIIQEEIGELTESQFEAVLKEMRRILSRDNVSITDYEYDVWYDPEKVTNVKIELDW